MHLPQRHRPSVHPNPPGSYLSADGPYQNTIARLGNKYPNLIQNDRKRYETNFRLPSRAAYLDFDSNKIPRKHVFPDLTELKSHLNSTASASEPPPRRRLYILEGTNVDYVAAFGEALQVDPRVFLRHKRIALWEKSHVTGNLPPLPSLLDPQVSFLLDYGELLYFKEALETFAIRCASNERHVAVCRLINDTFDRVGIARRKASFWARRDQSGGWDALIVVDEPSKEFFVSSRSVTEREALESEPFQGGYPDFLDYETLQDATRTGGPPRSSMFEDLCYYWENHGSLLQISENPVSATIFLQKIVASHYVLLAEYYRGVFSALEWILSRRQTYAELTVKWVEERWSDIQTFNRRSEDSLVYIRSIIRELRVDRSARASQSWSNTSEDFLAIEELFQDLKRKTESLQSSYTGLASIVGNRQSLTEARSVRILSILGMTFLPLSFTSGLFSMTDKYLPGASEFWVYFAVAVPLIFVTFALPMLISLGYESNNEDKMGNWLGTFWNRACPELVRGWVKAWKPKAGRKDISLGYDNK